MCLRAAKLRRKMSYLGGDGPALQPMNKISEKIAEEAELFFLKPWFGGITTIFGVIAGYLGSHYDTAIASAYYPAFWPDNDTARFVFSTHASIFWVAVGLFGASFTGTFWAQSVISRRETGKLQSATAEVSTKADSLERQTTEVSGKADALAAKTDQIAGKATELARKTDELSALIQQLHTLPPKGFLFQYGCLSRYVNKAFFSVQVPEATADDIAEAIRNQLSTVLSLARMFDNDGQVANYGCNVMIFRLSAGLSPDEGEILAGRLKFVDKAVAVSKLKGVLDLLPPLSVSSLKPTGPDDALAAFALPIPVPAPGVDPSKDITVLPGAPLAFVSKAEALIESPEDWEKRANPFAGPVQDELRQFFAGQRNVIQSFVCIPLYAETVDNGDTPIGILNIHRNLPNKLLGEKLELFAPLLVPIAILLGRLLDAYSRKGGTAITDERT